MADAATAETYTQPIPDIYLAKDESEQELPLFISVPEMGADKFTRKRAGHFIGEVMLGQMVETAEVFKHEKPIESLRDGIKWAAEGDTDGRKLVETNVATDVIERTIKTGHVMDPVRLEVTPEGKFVQYNQLSDAIYANSLQLAAGNQIMKDRTEAETRNKFRIEDLYRAGLFKDYNLVVFSLADDLPDIFFTETMSCSIQVLSEVAGGLQLESAFVAGIAEPGEERHDFNTIAKVGDKLGADFRDKTPAQIIDHPVLIRKDQMPDGSINLVELWDWAAGEGTFFGENKQAPCTYQEYLKFCQERTATFEPKVKIIRDQLISEAAQIKTRLQAIERLHELSEEQMVEMAIEDHSIDPRVFGGPSATAIVAARQAQAWGDAEAARRYTQVAKRTADSKSCPWMKKQKLDGTVDDFSENEDSIETAEDEDEFGSLTFECKNGHINTRPRHQKITECRVKSCEKGSVGC